MENVTAAMIEAGERVASDMIDISIAKSFSKDGEDWRAEVPEDLPNRDLVLQYVEDKISSVTAIFIAMSRAVQKETPYGLSHYNLQEYDRAQHAWP